MGLSPVCGPPGAGNAGPIDTDPLEVELVGVAQFAQQLQVQCVPYTGALPVAQPPPAGHAAAVAQFMGQLFPGDAGAQHEEDAVEGRLIAQPGPAPLGERSTWGSSGLSLLNSAVLISLVLFLAMQPATLIRRIALTGFC